MNVEHDDCGPVTEKTQQYNIIYKFSYGIFIFVLTAHEELWIGPLHANVYCYIVDRQSIFKHTTMFRIIPNGMK